jgi:hypothetical protein
MSPDTNREGPRHCIVYGESMKRLNFNNVGNNDEVGLSNPWLSQSCRRMLDLVNKLHSTGAFLAFQLSLID